MSDIVRTVRDDGVITYHDGDGMKHNDAGPAVIYPSGTVTYIIHGKYHREDGPAIIWADGEVEYYIDNVNYTEDEFKLKQFFKV